MSSTRDVTAPPVFAENATTTIPEVPLAGVAYRDELSGPASSPRGWPFQEVVNSAHWNQLVYQWSKLLSIIDAKGVLGWTDKRAYTEPAIVFGSDGSLYLWASHSGPGTPAGPRDPASGDGAGYWVALSSRDITGNAATATKLQTARTIGGVTFDGSANINLPGVNAAGNQNTSGNAATATKLQTARTINGVAFDGTANITVTADTTAASVMAANAAAAFGAVGTTAFLRVAGSNTPIVAGSTYAGSALRTSGVVTRISSDGNIFGAGEGVAVSGTWRAMGACAANGGSENYPSTVFLRIS